MSNPKTDIYFLIFSSIVLFFSIISFIVIFFRYYRKKQRSNFLEKEELKLNFKQELLQSQIEIQEEVFNNISQEIHDNVGQILSLAKIQVNIINETGNMDKGLLNDVKDNIGKALTDLRDIARSLNSDRIKGIGIHLALAIEAERINKTGLFHAKILVEGKERKMDEQKKVILFRILQESLQNIIKHAQASEVEILFNYMEDYLKTSIKDNGKGFDVENASRERAGIGLENIRTRAALTGGSSILESRPGEGTTITIEMPYE